MQHCVALNASSAENTNKLGIKVVFALYVLKGFLKKNVFSAVY